MQLDKYEIFEKGIYIEKMTDPNGLQDLINQLYPIKNKFDLIRIGGESDGGYLIPNDLKGISACFSPGVDYTANFEIELLSLYGISSHLADYSVEIPPPGLKAKSFIKKYIGTVNDEIFITLDNWVGSKENSKVNDDYLLQMDIEGGEYTAILNINEETLKKFRIIILEIHNVESWGQNDFFNLIVCPFFRKLLKYFHVVHNHPNNCCGIVNLGGVLAPRVFELSLLRKDRCAPLGFITQFPSSLDRPNVINRDHLILPKNWYYQAL